MKLAIHYPCLKPNLKAERSPLYKQSREIRAISLHRPTASSWLHYLDYSESAVHLKRHRQQGCICKTGSFMKSFIKDLRKLCCWVHRNAVVQPRAGKKKEKKIALTRSSLCHLNGCDPQGPDITLQNTQGIRSVSIFHMLSQHMIQTQCCCYPVVIGGVRVLITGNNLRCHPVRCANEGVPTPNGPVQLSTHPKINWMWMKRIGGGKDVRQWGIAFTHIFAMQPKAFNVPSLTSAFSVSSTFWPLMSLWITLWAWRWERPWA